MEGFCDEQDESVPVHFLKKPLFHWIKHLAESHFTREDSFSKFVGSDVLQRVLQYAGVSSISSLEFHSQSTSLSLSGTFDDLESAGSSLTSTTTRKQESETKQKIRKLSEIIESLRLHYDHDLNRLLLLPLPNPVHIATACERCGITEMEKVMNLLLGVAIHGNQQQDLMRRIREFPTQLQQQLIQAIKEVTDNPGFFETKSWSVFYALAEDDQKQIYHQLLTQCRQLIHERDTLLQWRRLTEFGFGLTQCDDRPESVDHSPFNSLSFDLERFGEKRNSSRGVARQLREDLSEKSDLLKECREELEMTASNYQQLQKEMAELRIQLKVFKTSRDELDILREGQEKAARLEGELGRMRKKLEEAEQYYEQAQILENENKAYLRKIAVLTDRINVLTVENERLELSFLAQQSHIRSPFSLVHAVTPEQGQRSLSYTPNPNGFPDQLLLDFEGEQEQGQTQPESKKLQDDKPSSASAKGDKITCTESATMICYLPSDQVKVEVVKTSKDAETQNESGDLEKPFSLKGRGHGHKERRAGGPKRSHRRNGGAHGKRTKKSNWVVPQSKATLQKVTPLQESSVHNKQPQDMTPQRSKFNQRNEREKRRRSLNDPCRPDFILASNLLSREAESDADEELSLSPHQSLGSECESDSELEGLEYRRPLRAPLPCPSLPAFGGDMESDGEQFFVCSTIQLPPMARNVRIYAPSSNGFRTEVYSPRPQYCSTPRPRDEPPQLLGIRTEPKADTQQQHTTPLVNIHLKQVSRQELTLRPPPPPLPIKDYSYMNPRQAPMGHRQQEPRDSVTTTDEDDSVWYEYGCV